MNVGTNPDWAVSHKVIGDKKDLRWGSRSGTVGHVGKAMFKQEVAIRKGVVFNIQVISGMSS